MRLKRNGLALKSKLLIALAIFSMTGGTLCAQGPLGMDSVSFNLYTDSIRQTRFTEIDFIIDNIENIYVSGRRGLTDEQWDKGKEIL